nr:CAP domain-containing protein [Lachnospiraceae bacterium]
EGEYYTEVFNQLNDYRAANGLNRLHYNTSLQYAANTRALEASFYFEHTRPNQERWNTVCPEWKYGGENIASGQSTPTNVMNAWKNSEGHNRNMLYGLESGQKPFAGVSIGVFHRYLFTSAVRPSIPNEVITWSQNFTFYEY